ncbi:dihydrodipicolinate synthase family protein [Actinophytocola sp. NPDC049390]|uniref:dihydrodipicolinate synthase family protein n=1 Tax=Actinophytocola sp. NPDC049390 TaxID=3363894 RepID=UPI0037915D03
MPLAPLLDGAVIPAHPLALTAGRTLDERRQRALTRYYLASGVGGLAVGVHTTQFAIREAGLFRPVLELAAETIAESGRDVVAVAGACGPVEQAVAEASLAADLGYDAVLLSPVVPGADEEALLARAKAVGEVLPVIGFYLQAAIGGPVLSRDFWRALADQPSTAAIKVAPFDRYRTIEVAHGVAAADRRDEVALYTGNDDHIIGDLLATLPGGLRFRGGLLGQWAVWTRAAMAMFDQVRTEPTALVAKAQELTDANAAVFDAANGFAGCIAGVHEVLRRQGLFDGIWCLDPDETLSPGQAAELSRVSAAYPWLTDDEFVAEHRDAWLS